MLFLVSVAYAASNDAGTSELDFTGLFLKMIALLAVVVVLGFVLIRFMSPSGRFRIKGSNHHFELVGSYRLEPKKAVYLLRIGKRLFALGSAESNLQTLAELHDEDLKE